MSHYFSPDPAGPEKRRTIRTRLADRDVEVVTSGGVFSPDRVDLGTRQLLLAASDLPDRGTFVDLGCGWGPIALSMAMARPAGRVYGVDVNSRALGLLTDNAQRLGVSVTALAEADAAQHPELARIDVLLSNPPIRIGKEALHELLATWLPRLAPAGYAELVVAKNLGADSLATWIGAELDLICNKVASRKGYRILRVERPDQ